MRRTLGALITALAIPLALAGCGGSTQTATIGISLSGVSMSIVATGNSAGIDNAKKQAAAAGGGASVTVTDGDTHTGAKVCETDVTDSSGTYHIIVYSDSSAITSAICDQMKTSSGS